MRAGLGRNNRAAFLAEERVFKEQGRDAQFSRREVLKNLLGIIGAVIVADAGMIAPDDEMRAAVILAVERVENRFTRSRIAHRCRKDTEQHAVRRIVIFK